MVTHNLAPNKRSGENFPLVVGLCASTDGLDAYTSLRRYERAAA